MFLTPHSLGALRRVRRSCQWYMQLFIPQCTAWLSSGHAAASCGALQLLPGIDSPVICRRVCDPACVVWSKCRGWGSGRWTRTNVSCQGSFPRAGAKGETRTRFRRRANHRPLSAIPQVLRASRLNGTSAGRRHVNIDVSSSFLHARFSRTRIDHQFPSSRLRLCRALHLYNKE